MNNTFSSFELPENLIKTLDKINFTTPTPIQNAAIPIALSGKDILGSAQTGTGKTGAFAIPIVSKILNKQINSALIMAPTRELATQVLKQFEILLGRHSKINTALLIGGEPIFKQIRQLDKNPQVIVGTPGRINDHIERETLNLSGTDFLVLDETDRMLDMGFSEQIESIIALLPEKKQTLLFSATLPKNIVGIAQRYLNQPERISVDKVSSPAENVEQKTIKVSVAEKFNKMVEELEQRPDVTTVIFMKTKLSTEKMAYKLEEVGFKARAIHGDLRQNKRERVIRAFRSKKFDILVATDVAARGLDIPHIEQVINYDLPQSPEDYIHRIGRTGRAGAKGFACSLVTPQDKRSWQAIDRLLNPELYKNQKEEAPRRFSSGGGRRGKFSKFTPAFRSPRRDGGGFSSFRRRDEGGFGRDGGFRRQGESSGFAPRGEGFSKSRRPQDGGGFRKRSSFGQRSRRSESF